VHKPHHHDKVADHGGESVVVITHHSSRKADLHIALAQLFSYMFDGIAYSGFPLQNVPYLCVY